MYWPSSVTSLALFRRFSLGTKKSSNAKKLEKNIKFYWGTQSKDFPYPLANPFSPIFLPISPTVTPGRGRRVEVSRTWATNMWIPWLHPSGVINWAYTTAWVAALPRFPIQNLMASWSGVWMIKPCTFSRHVAIWYWIQKNCTNLPS